jgi:hypothetical protein
MYEHNKFFFVHSKFAKLEAYVYRTAAGTLTAVLACIG